MASSSFRDSFKSLGWSRQDQDLPVRTSSTTPILTKIQNLNPFSGNGLRLPTDENPGAPLPARTRREEEDAWFTLSRWDRILVFSGLNLAALVLFVICFTLLIFRPTKFAILWTVASVLFLASWAVMMGPMTYVRHLASGPRLPFTAVYFGSIALTLYSALGLQSTILTMVASIVQMIALIYYLISYFPMGSTGLRLGTQVASNRIAAWMSG